MAKQTLETSGNAFNFIASFFGFSNEKFCELAQVSKSTAYRLMGKRWRSVSLEKRQEVCRAMGLTEALALHPTARITITIEVDEQTDLEAFADQAQHAA